MWLRNREGTEPSTARSPYRLRRVLSLTALVLGLLATIFFVVQAVGSGEEVWVWEAAIAAAVAIIAAIDLVVIQKHLHR
jgi:membrane protein YdbS with pleckstrin-like domain